MRRHLSTLASAVVLAVSRALYQYGYVRGFEAGTEVYRKQDERIQQAMLRERARRSLR